MGVTATEGFAVYLPAMRNVPVMLLCFPDSSDFQKRTTSSFAVYRIDNHGQTQG